MNKQAKLLTSAFIAMDAVDGAKKVGKAYKQTNNTYSDALGTTVNKSSKKMGGANAEIANPKLASETIDDMCKVAVSKTPIKKAIIGAKWGKRNLERGIEKIDAANTQHIRNAIDAVKNKQLVRGVSEAGKASLVTLPAVAGMAAAGKGAERVMKKFDKYPDNPENELERKVVGAGVTGALLLNAVANKRALKPATTALEIAGTKAAKYPLNIVRKSKAGNVIGQFAKQVGKQGSKAVKDVEKASRYSKVWKKASAEIDELEKIAGKKMDFAKDLAVNHFLKEGLKSIPYYTAPAALGFMLNRDIKNGLKKFDERNSPKEQLKEDLKDFATSKNKDVEKVAKLINFDKQKVINALSKDNIRRLTTKDNLRKAGVVALERGADGLGRTMFPATVTAITGRNIMNSFKKLEDGAGSTPQEDMANKIIIQINGAPSKRNLKREVSKEIDKKYSMDKKASQDESLDVGDILKDINDQILSDALKKDKDARNVSKMPVKKIHIGQGVKKTFRMHD